MRTMMVPLVIGGLLVAGAAPAAAARELGATEFGEVSVTGSSPVCFGKLATEVQPFTFEGEGKVAARFDFSAAIPFVPLCVVPVTISWQNLDTGDSGEVVHDIVPVNPLSANSSHGVGGDYAYFVTGMGRIVLRVSTNPVPAQVEITVQ